MLEFSRLSPLPVCRLRDYDQPFFHILTGSTGSTGKPANLWPCPFFRSVSAVYHRILHLKYGLGPEPARVIEIRVIIRKSTLKYPLHIADISTRK